MKFDINGARKAGYSDDEIAGFLAEQNKFDLGGALSSGYSSSEVIDFLLKQPVAPAPAPAPVPRQDFVTGDPMGMGFAEIAAAPTAPGRSVMEGYVPTAKDRQAEIDRRLSYGAGPISQETARQADVVRSTRGTRDAVAPANRQVQKVVQAMDERGEQSFGDLMAIANKDKDLKRIEAELEAEGRQRFAKENPILGSIAAGSAGLISGAINFPSVAADAFNQVAVNPVLRALGMDELPRAPTAFGTEYLTKSASDYMPKIGKQEMSVAIARDEFAPWLMSKLAANSPQIAQSVAAAMVPPLRAVLLPGMGATAAGQSYVEGDDSRVALAKGAIEIGTEMLPLGVFDKIGSVLKGMSPVKANTVLAVAGQRMLQAGGAITANTLTNTIEETAAQLGGNVLDKYFQGKDIELTKGLAEAAVVGAAAGGVLSTPQAAGAIGGAYDPNAQIAREINAAGRAFDRVGDVGSQAITIDMLRTEPGSSNLISPAATVTNFTPPESATKRAGLVDIVVPVPGGLDVSTAGVPGGLAAGGGDLGGNLALGGVGAAGRGVPGAAGGTAGAGPGVRADDASALATGGAAGQPLAGLNRPLQRATDADLLARTEAAVSGYNNANIQPAEIWTGRRGDGYATQGDAEQALPGRQRKYPDLTWSIEQMPGGKFRLAGYSQETTLGTQADQAQQGQPQAPQAGQAAGAQAAAGQSTPATQVELSDSERAGLKLALPAPATTFQQVQTQLQQRRGVTVDAVPVAELTDSQRLASTVARLMGNTLTVVRATSGDTTAVPNGFINRLGGKHIFIDSNTDDAPLSIAMHEGLHSLPAERRKALNTALLETFNQDQRDEFLREFGYTADKFDEEAPAMMAQAISKRADFWEQLRDKMGNREFGEVAKVILSKLNQVITGARDQYGDAFVNKYISDVVKARDLLTTAYAETMQAQGLKPDTALVGDVQMSNRAEQKNVAASRIEDVSADRFKRTPALQVALQDLQEGRITRAEYSKVVDETRPVYPYKELPEITPEQTARFALANGRGQSVEKAAKYGLPSKELTQGEMVQLRLDIPSYQEHDAWVVTVHRPKTTNRSVQAAYDAGPTVGYESVASITNATFGMRQSSALKIAQGTSKGTIATVLGEWKPITPAEAKVKAQAAMKSPDWTQVGMDPFRHSYFYDRDSMRPVVAADEVIQVGPLVLAKNAKYDDNVDVTGAPLMFSEKAREPVKVADYNPKTDNFNKQRDMTAALNESVPPEVVAQADEFVAKYYAERKPVGVAPQDRLRAEILLRPKMQQAEQAKPEFDQKILNIAASAGAAGHILAPIKGIKRAAEKLAIEEDFQVDNIKDLLRATIVVDSYSEALPIIDQIRKEFDVVRIKDRAGAGVSGENVSAADRQAFGGYADVLINIRMPNGTIGEIQINTPAMLAAKGNQGHKLYEAAREQPNGSPQQAEIYDAMRVLYDAAFSAANLRQPAAQSRKAASDMGAPLAGSDLTAISSSPESASLKTRSSGKVTNSSPENDAKNSQPGGKEAGSFIEGTPDTESVSQDLYLSSKAGDYEYTTDKKGRITVSGDIDRIKFLTRGVAKGTAVDGGAIVFKADDAKQVIKALKDAPKVNPEIATAIGKQLGLSEAELASTSLAYQTGLPKDRAFVAPLKGGIPEVVQFLEDRRRQSGLRLLDISNPEDQDTLAKLMAAETLAAIRSSGNALEWYDETIARTLAMAAVKYPELGNDRNAQMAFRVAMAITSQGLNVENNLKFTMRQYDAFRNSSTDPAGRRFPEIGEGDSSQAMVSNFKLINELLAEMGPDMLRRFLVTEFTIGELNQAGFEPGGELVDEKVLGSSVLGPKIGFGFYSNLNGNFEPVTMDMWFMRTIGRLSGTLRAFDAEKFAGQLQRFRNSFDERGTDGVFADQFDQGLIERARTSQEAAIELARQVKKAHEKDYKTNRADFDAKTRKKSNLVLAAETMIQSVDKPKDVPASGSERRNLRAVVRKAVAEVEKSYGQRIPPAAMQALIWYPEQELYKAMGVKLSVTSQDYAGATEKVLTEEGYDAKRLRAAAKSGADRVRQANARDVDQAAQSDGQRAGRAGPLEGAERAGFIRARYERTQLERERLEPKRKGVIFEVAPDPHNEALTNAWRALSQEQRLAISERVARSVVPSVLKQFDTDGIIAAQVGSYLDDTNPSFTLLLNKGDTVEIARTLGFALAQDSMMVVSPKEFKGGEKVGAIALEVGDKTSAEIDGIYQKLREIRVGDEQPIGGQSYANGVMTILNYSNVPTGQLAVLVDQKLNKAYTILTRDVFAAFPGKQEYDYASAANDGRGSRADLRQRARALRAEATAALERELEAEGVQLADRAGAEAAAQEGRVAEPGVDIQESRRLPKVSPQSALNRDIEAGVSAMTNAVERVRAGRPVPSKLVIGRLPHVLNMLGARTQDFDIARSIVEKVFEGKHRDEFPDMDPKDLVRAMYRPAMIFKSKDGVAREFELVLPITNENGAMLLPIKVSVDNTDPLGAVMSIYNKRVSTNLQAQGEKTIMRRINDGSLLYVDPLLAKQALTGRADDSGIKANENFVSWAGVWPKLQKLIADRKVKTDTDLMRWIGDNYNPRSSEQGWEDAPAFSNRSTPEMGINVASDTAAGRRYADLIVDGQKTYESRETDSLRPYVGKRVSIVRTGEGKAKAIGAVTIGEPITVDAARFRQLEKQHMVPRGSKFDIKPGASKLLYPLTEPERFDEEYDVSAGIVSRKVTDPKRAEVATLFRDLQGSRGLTRVRALERVDAHPMAETIRRIDQEFMDILERLDDAGLVKINCK